MSERDDKRATVEEDDEVEATVLRQLLERHPSHLSLEELTREIVVDPECFAERDAIERAVRDLARAGLLHRNEDFVFPTRAALRFDELLG